MRRQQRRKRWFLWTLTSFAVLAAAAFTAEKYGVLSLERLGIDFSVPQGQLTENQADDESSEERFEEIAFTAQGEPAQDGGAARETNRPAGNVNHAVYSTENTEPSGRNGSRTAVKQAANEVSAPPEKPRSLKAEIDSINQQLEAGETLAAHRGLSQLYWNRPDSHSQIARRIQQTAKEIYFSPQPHFMKPYVVQPGDQLRRIAQKYKISWQYLAKLNRTDPRRLRPGMKLKVIKGPFSALVDVSDFTLTLHAHGYFVKRYLIGVGKGGSTPHGTFKVLEKVDNPQYTGPDGKVIDADDPSNPLGDRWLDLGDGYGIHGTIDPTSIGKSESRGCIRMRNADVEEVYDILTKGSQVIIRR